MYVKPEIELKHGVEVQVGKTYGRRTVDKNGDILHQFDSLREFVQASVKGANPEAASHDSYGGDEWSGGLKFPQASQLAIAGWHGIRPQVDAILEPVRERLAEKLDISFEREYDMFGAEACIDRYLDDELECMFEDMPREAPKMGKVITVIVNACVSSGVPADEIFARGAALVALVDTMQVLGFDMDIWVEMTTSSRNKWTALVKVHSAGQILDVDNIMYAIGHPSMLRRTCFGVMESEASDIRKRQGFGPEGWGYGRPEGLTRTQYVNASIALSWGGRADRKVISDPVGWVLDQLASQGVYNGEER